MNSNIVAKLAAQCAEYYDTAFQLLSTPALSGVAPKVSLFLQPVFNKYRLGLPIFS